MKLPTLPNFADLTDFTRSPLTTSRSVARWAAIGLLAVLGGGVHGVVHAQSCGAGETKVVFGFTGAEQTTVVPADAGSMTVYLSGAQGGAGLGGAGTLAGSPTSPGGTGGLGARVSGSLSVTPGATLSIWVGGQGSQAVNPGGLGNGTYGIGGGATDIRIGGNAIGNRVAGGGGGGGNAGWSESSAVAGGAGGAGGAGAGGPGANVPGGQGPFGGGGGAVGTGGAAGGGCSYFPGTDGNASTGKGGETYNFFPGSFNGAGFGGGGGGGATIGAGGGGGGVGTTACVHNWNGGGGGGAGGSSSAGSLSNPTLTSGVQQGDGAVIICFAPPS